MMYGSWEIKFNRQAYFVILGNSLSFFPPNSPKTENFKKKKKSLEISSFNTNVPKIMIIWYIAPEIWHMIDVIVIFDFGLFLPFYSLNSPKKSKSQKYEKKDACRYHHFTQMYQKSWSYAIPFLRYTVRHGCNCYFLFWAFFCPFTPLTAWKNKISKK